MSLYQPPGFDRSLTSVINWDHWGLAYDQSSRQPAWRLPSPAVLRQHMSDPDVSIHEIRRNFHEQVSDEPRGGTDGTIRRISKHQLARRCWIHEGRRAQRAASDQRIDWCERENRRAEAVSNEIDQRPEGVSLDAGVQLNSSLTCAIFHDGP